MMRNSIDDVANWRRSLHRIPELLYDLPLTTAYVIGRLREFGVDTITTGVGGCGIVATIRGGLGDGKTVALRADMDALPITENTGLDYASQHAGRMHACGHDGHTAMLLGAARHMASHRDFHGTAVLIFQPAEEGGAGARAMIEDRVLERFRIEEIYGMHNMPGLATGSFGTRDGAIMASSDIFTIRVTGRGGHAAAPHLANDVVLAGATIVQSLQQIVARNIDPTAAAVLSVTCFNAGSVENVLASEAILKGTVRAFDETTQDVIQTRMLDITQAIGAAHDVTVDVDYIRQYPATINDTKKAALVTSIAKTLIDSDKVDANTPAQMASEDFSYFLQQRPGAFFFVGNGKSAALHNPAYDFNDAILAVGVKFWCRLLAEAVRDN